MKPTQDGKLELRYDNFKEPTALIRLVADDLPDNTNPSFTKLIVTACVKPTTTERETTVKVTTTPAPGVTETKSEKTIVTTTPPPQATIAHGIYRFTFFTHSRFNNLKYNHA